VLDVAVDSPAGAPAAPPEKECPIVRDAGCYAVWRTALERGAVAAPLRIQDEGLFAEAREAQAQLDKAGLRHVKFAITPFGVRLSGAKDDAERRRAIRAVWPAVLGPLRLD